MERVLRACARHGVAIEINAHPWRLDMNWRWCARGLELGCLFSINPDAHSTEEIDNIQWGVSMARKGAVPKGRVLNAMSRAEFGGHLQNRRMRLRAATHLHDEIAVCTEARVGPADARAGSAFAAQSERRCM